METGFSGVAVAIAAGGNHSLVLDQQNALWAWGSNEYGQLGRGRPMFALNPQKVDIGQNNTHVAA